MLDESPLPSQMTSEEASEIFSYDSIEEHVEEYPLKFSKIEEEQGKDEDLQKMFLENKSKNYTKKEYFYSDYTYRLICYNDRIVLPKSLQGLCVRWYHQWLQHPGMQRTELTIAQHYYWKGMRTMIMSMCKKCSLCQLTKANTSAKYGKIPPKKLRDELLPWHTVHIDLIGPYNIGATPKGKEQRKFKCLTMIDPATGWFEIAHVEDKYAITASQAFETTWLMRYPWPTEVVVDRGTEFMGELIRMCREDYNIKRKPISTRNPQSNSMIERAHQTIGNMFRTKQLHNYAYEDVDFLLPGLLNSVAFAMRSTIHTTLNATPTQLVFGRDHILPVQFQADWDYIRSRKLHRIIQNNKKENAKRIEHQYNVGDRVKVLQDPNAKYGDKDRFVGPQTVTAVYDNGTVMLTRDTERGAVSQTWNIRAISPWQD